MSECTHDCSTCQENCGERQEQDLRAKLNPAASVKKVIAVVSGKGGVGKSLVTGLLASKMQSRGYQAAVLDADITGPSIPKSFGIHEHARGTEDMLIPCYSNKGTQIMSVNLILDNETDPVVWRGPVIAGVVTQFWSDVLWDDVDYMFVDMPPGTGDVPLTVFQSLPIDGIVIVTSPQELVSMIVAKAVNMAKLMNIPRARHSREHELFQVPRLRQRARDIRFKQGRAGRKGIRHRAHRAPSHRPRHRNHGRCRRNRKHRRRRSQRAGRLY